MALHKRVALLLCIVLSLLLAAQAKDEPDIKSTPFPDIPTGLFYFDDSDVVFVLDPSARQIHRSEDTGVNWTPLDVGKGKIFEVQPNPHDNKVAVVIGIDGTHWITKDQGKTWKTWECAGVPTMLRAAMGFHAMDPDRMLYHTAECHGTECHETVYYTTDGFSTEPKKMRDDALTCLFAQSSGMFKMKRPEVEKTQVFCIVKGSFDSSSNNYRLVSSTDFFQNEDVEPVKHEDRAVTGIMNLAAVKSYIVAAAKSEGTTELALYTTDDAVTWRRAVFSEHKLEEDAYTLLESTNYSMQVDVLTTKPGNPMGVLLTSNSDGTFFRKNVEHTNRNTRGFVDFEKVQNIQGIVLVNTVANWEEIERDWVIEKKVTSQISFDDGRTFHDLKAGDDKLHLHSVTDQRNTGRIYSSPAPGIVMGIGNTGDYLHSRDQGDLYISDDAGLTWRKARSGPHLYEFGDSGALLVAVEDGETNKVKWSLNHGQNWTRIELDDEIIPIALTTVPDSTALRFILTAIKGRGTERKFHIYSLDFRDLSVKKCGSTDFEDWYARVDSEGKPTCIMGHTQKFRRRKADSICFVGEKFKDPVPVADDCKCTDEDYECDYENGFAREEGQCRAKGPMVPPEGACKSDSDKTFTGPSGYRLIPGNTCIKSGGVEKDKPVERPCGELDKPVVSGKISSHLTRFTGKDFVEYYYRERVDTNNGDDETVIMRTNDREVYVTRDHGKSWQQIYKDEEIVAIYPHQYINEQVYLITPGNKVYYSKDRAASWSSFQAPEPPNTDHIQILSFHPKEKDWLLWTGAKDCQDGRCNTIARVSTKGGDDWNKLLSGVRKCQFVWREDRADSDQLVYCEQHVDENMMNSLTLLSSDDWFEHRKELKRDVINFATMSEFIVVAVRDTDQQSLQVDTSIDGKVFADAKFPPNFNIPHQQAYTVLDSSTHAVFLHVTRNNMEDSEYGSIVKSNSNGTSYVMSVDHVNRNKPGYVDFEKMQGLEGVAVINRVANVEEVEKGMQKKLKTYITHNDGADWALIRRPEEKPRDVTWCNDSDMNKCSLHLHGYTERKDPRDTFSSPSAVGLMMATGNVGEFLKPRNEADTFITRNGGVSWAWAAPGSWMWEYGDQGSIIAIVKEDEPTKSIMYTLNEGENWIRYDFSETEMLISDLTTLPSDSSRNFLLWGKLNGELATVNIDFSSLEERSKKCKLNEQDPGKPESDYILWSPSHPNSDDNCLFGHVAQYHRKKTDRACYNGRDVSHLHAITKNCSCTVSDFECEYNYERQNDGSCALVTGLSPPDPKDVCKKAGVKEYYGITGYRRIPITTCEGGKELTYTAQSYPCPGFEDEYAKKHGLSGVATFFIVALVVSVAAGIGYWVYTNWEGKFGRIRLGDGASTLTPNVSRHAAFDRDAPWIKYPILVLSGVVAVIAATPMVIGSLYKMVATRLGRSRGGYARPYTSRGSFGRGRGSGGYAVVAEDEGELLGEDSDED